MSDWNTDNANVEHVNGTAVGAKEEDLAKAREAGWTERTAFDYDKFAGTDATSTDWAGAAKKYEWSDSYGEVGTEIPELERQLFGGEFQMRRGEHIKNLEFEVNREGPTQIAPALAVGRLIAFLLTTSILLMSSLVCRCWSAPSGVEQHSACTLRAPNSDSVLYHPSRLGRL